MHVYCRNNSAAPVSFSAVRVWPDVNNGPAPETPGSDTGQTLQCAFRQDADCSGQGIKKLTLCFYICLSSSAPQSWEGRSSQWPFLVACSVPAWEGRSSLFRWKDFRCPSWGCSRSLSKWAWWRAPAEMGAVRASLRGSSWRSLSNEYLLEWVELCLGVKQTGHGQNEARDSWLSSVYLEILHSGNT